MNRSKLLKRLLCFLVAIIFFESAALITIILLKNNLVFKLNGEQTIVLNLDDNYVDEGYVANTMQWNLSDYVTVENNLDTKTVGDYQVKYELLFLNQHYYLERDIKIVDTIMPDITLNGDNEIRIYVGDDYNEEGATARDNYDGDITSNIEIASNLDTSQEGEYEIVYTVQDSSGNDNSITRNVIVEKKPEPQVAPVNTQSSMSVPLVASSDPIADYIRSHGYDVSVGYYNLITGRQYFYQENRLYYGASLIKTLDALYLYDNNMVDETIKHYIDRAISVSDNNAHLYLINYIGKDALRRYGIGLGAANTLSYDSSYGDTTVIDQLAYYKKAYEIAMSNNDFKMPFINNYYNYIKVDGLDAMHKHGYYDEWYHDAGIIFDKEPYIVIILTKHGKGNKYEVIHNLTNIIYKYHKGIL